MSTKYLLDTNVLSESRRKHADVGVVSFLGQTEPSLLMISVLTLGELRKGVVLKQKTDPDAARRLEVWVDGLEISFTAQILGIRCV